MGVKIGDRFFKTNPTAFQKTQDEKRKLYSVAASYNVLLGAGLRNQAISIFDNITLPNSAFLKQIFINGTYLDTATSSPKTDQPLIEMTLFQFGLAGSLNTQVPQYALNASAQIDSTVFITGRLNSMPIKFDSSLYISGQTILVLSGIAYFYAPTLATDSLIINARLVFEE